MLKELTNNISATLEKGLLWLKKNIEPSSHKKLEMEKLEKNDGVEDYC
jgi:hypothetical protein